MPGPTGGRVLETLSKSQLHEEWTATYRVEENEPFMEMAFDEITRHLHRHNEPYHSSGNATRTATNEGRFLDAGCGTGCHAMRLIKRGFRVHALDFSEYALTQAKRLADAELGNQGDRDRLEFSRGNLLALSFPDETFQYVLCWGVLMHIPEIEKAVHELARVVRPGGTVIIGENNAHSLEWTLYRFLNRHTSRRIHSTPAGLESSWEHQAGTIFVRQQNIPWLIKSFAAEGLVLERRIARQFTEGYTKVASKRVRRMIHRINNAYFKYVRLAHPAGGNLLFFRKQTSVPGSRN